MSFCKAGKGKIFEEAIQVKAIRSKSGIIQLMLDTGAPLIRDEETATCTVAGIKVSTITADALWLDGIFFSGEYNVYKLYGRATTVGQVMETRIDAPISGAAHP